MSASATRDEVGGRRDPGERGLSTFRVQLALRDRALEVAGDPVTPRLGTSQFRLVQDDVLADRRVHLRDAVPHQPRAGDEHPIDGHGRSVPRPSYGLCVGVRHRGGMCS